jgi:CDP-diacylglycerol--glycerol-3-phosphate 3-phosphatidyltransferase
VRPLGLGWPNIVSIARICAVPFMVWLMVLPGEQAAWAATILFAVGAATDRLDGYLARRHGMVTATGAWLDPLADKLFVITPIVVMVVQDRFPWWAAAVIIVREAAVSLYRWRLDKEGMSMPASSAGKLKTVVQLVAIGVGNEARVDVDTVAELSLQHLHIIRTGSARQSRSGLQTRASGETRNPSLPHSDSNHHC